LKPLLLLLALSYAGPVLLLLVLSGCACATPRAPRSACIDEVCGAPCADDRDPIFIHQAAPSCAPKRQ